MHKSDRKPPRFPFVGAVLCTACIGAAAWLWMRYSYCWDVTPRDFWVDRVRSGTSGAWPLFPIMIGTADDGTGYSWHPNPSLVGKYVRLTGYLRGGSVRELTVAGVPLDQQLRWPVSVALAPGTPMDLAGDELLGSLTGRVVLLRPSTNIQVDCAASRFTGASIAGLVVGAMGVFVFGAALRHWLNQRRAFRTPDTAAPPESPA